MVDGGGGGGVNITIVVGEDNIIMYNVTPACEN